MKFLRNTFYLSALLTFVLMLSACPDKTTISKINADPARYRNKEVGVVGTVTDSYGLLGNGVYEIDDGTGRMWVMTRHGVPHKGSRVGAAGQIHTGVSYGGRNYGMVLEETERRSSSK